MTSDFKKLLAFGLISLEQNTEPLGLFVLNAKYFLVYECLYLL